MGNRFRDLAQYHTLIKGHGIIATITFLFIVPAAILIARFYGRNPGWALRMHIYLQIMTVALTTTLFVLGWMAVGPERSLTNPHHGIGLAIYVIILVQALGGGWIYRREKGKVRRKLPIKLVLHQWLGRAVALLGIVQVPLGLTLYGSPKFTFVLYALWMAFLLVLYFVLSYRALPPIGPGTGPLSSHGGTVITEKKKRGWLGPLAAGAGIAALLARRRSKRKERERSRSRSRTRVEVIPSRRGSRRDSGSFIEEEKYETRHDESGGFLNKLLKGGAIVGAGALAKSWYDRRQRRKEEDEYSSVAPDTPSRRHGRHERHDSVSSDSLSVDRMEQGRPNILPGPGNPAVAAAAISAAERPVMPRPTQPARRHSFDSSYYTDSLSAANSPSRRPQSTHKLRNSVVAGVGLGWAAKKWKDRNKRKEQDRLDQLEEDQRIEEERRARQGKTPTKYTGDGFPSSSRRHGRRGSRTHSSDLSSIIVDDVHSIRPGAIPPIPAAAAGGVAGAALASGGRSSSRHDLPPSEHPSNLPPPPHFPQADSGSEMYASSGGAMHRRHSSRRRREGEAAAAAAVAGAAGLAAEEEAKRRRSRSRDYSQGPAVASPPVSIKVQMHGDKDQNVTLRRLTEQEAAAEREAHRKRSQRRRRADSLSDSNLSGTDITSNRRRFRRERREADEIAAEKRAEANMPPAMADLSPPNPAFAGGRRPKDSAYYSGRPEGSGIAEHPGLGSVESPGSHGTWSALSPESGSEAAAKRRQRRKLERNQRPPGTVDFT